jgi:hypothetical protein
MLQPLEPAMNSPRCHLTFCYRQLTTNSHISNSLFFTIMPFYPTQQTITTTFPSPSRKSQSQSPRSQPDCHIVFPFQTLSPLHLSRITSHHITPAVKPSRLGLGVFPTPSLSFLPFCRPLSPSRSSMLPRSPLLPTAAHFPTHMASYLPCRFTVLFAFALPRCFCFCLPHGISSFWTEGRETRVET